MKGNWLAKSGIPGINFPAIPDREAATMLAIQFQLAQSEWWTADELLSVQLRELTPLVHHARDSTRHYRTIHIGDDATLTQESFRSLPLLRRGDIQTAGDDLFSNRIPELHGPTTEVMTSGSSGRPVTVLKSQLSARYWKAFTLRDSLWHRRDLSAQLGSIRYVADPKVGRPPDGTTFKGWGPATDEIFPSAPASLLSVGTSIEEQAEWLIRRDPAYLVTHPSNLRALAEHFMRNALPRPASLVQVRTVGELLPQETRDLCREVFGVGIADMYSAQEVGYIALQCPESDNYHVQAENVLVEVLDDAGDPCAPGEIGEVVVTDLHNYASPLLRYAIGDFAEVGVACRCGRGLPTLTRIIGRQRNMWVRPDGRRAWPLITSKKMRGAAPYRQLQLEQESMGLIVVRVVPDGAFTREDQTALAGAIWQCLEHRVELRFDIVDSIKRGPAGKFEEFICRI